MVKLKVVLNGIIEGLLSYQDLSLESGKSHCIDSIFLAIDGAQQSMNLVNSRGFVSKYWNGTKDKNEVSDCVEILENALKALMTKIKLANQGAIRG